jgi:hypothetical protein
MTLSIILMASCNGQNNKETSDGETPNIYFIDDTSKGGFVTDIHGGERSTVYRFVSFMANKLNISKIDSGFKSIQIRIWFGLQSVPKGQLFLLKNANGKWNAQLFNYHIIHNEKNYRIIDSVTYDYSNVSPKSNWSSVYNKLTDLKLMELPDMDSIAGSIMDFLHGDAVVVEVATNKKYRLYSYIDPEDFADRWWQAKNMSEIVNFIQKEFGFKRIKQIKEE